MLTWQMHHALRRHQICPYPYICTALMLANCLLHRRRHSRRRQSPLRARTSALHECAMPALVHRAHQPCTFLHLPCPYLCASSVCARLPCFLCLSPRLLAYGLLGGCTQAPLHMPQPLGGESPPQSWACGGDTYEWRAAAPTLFDFVLTVTSSIHRRDTYSDTHRTPLHATTLHHTLTPSTRHVSELSKIVFPKYSSQSRRNE
mmetsp:Transcript_45810/g.67162  ORF Transcript_45810/g.67162 Transcript_45810/m.67162 type:complete len:203 (+) Transcript_45810:408-1016(+)